MEDTIKNKVKESGLVQLDLADFKPKIQLASIDLAAQLWQGFVLKEKDFRAWIKAHDWASYQGKAVCIFCSTDAIIPTWAFMLVSSALTKVGVPNQVGSKLALAKMLITKEIEALDPLTLTDARVIIKGCADIQDPAFAMSFLVNHLQAHVKAIMYGEPCSTVPIFKK